jgi:hypothetical protein
VDEGFSGVFNHVPWPSWEDPDSHGNG